MQTRKVALVAVTVLIWIGIGYLPGGGMAADRHLWIADNSTSKILKYDIEGHFQYAWGSQGEWPGAMWNVHGMSVDQDGNLYLAEVKQREPAEAPSAAGAQPALVIGQPIRSAS